MSVSVTPRVSPGSILCSGLMLIACAVFCGIHIASLFPQKQGTVLTSRALILPALTPWSSIGGCGAGGSGGGAGGGAKWVGRGITGGLLDMQIMGSDAIGQNFNFKTVSTRLSIKPSYTSTLGLSIPIVSKIGVSQAQSNFVPSTEVTGGLGDISIDYSKNIGMEGQYSLSLALSLPVGQYNIKRGSENESKILPLSLQKGSGVYSSTLGLSFTKDFDDGMLLFDAFFSQPFMVSFTGKNALLNTFPAYAMDSLSAADRVRMEYYFKPYGENDLGGFLPPSVSASVFYGDKKEELYTYSYGVTFAVPLGVTWIPSFLPGDYNPRPDPDFQTWTASLNYGVEFTNPKYPIFIAVSLPIHDKTNPPDSKDPLQQWDGPDLKDLFAQWSFAMGIKATLF